MLLKGWVYKYSYQGEILYIGSTQNKSFFTFRVS